MIEYIAAGLNIAFVVLIGYGFKWGWIPGIVGSVLSAYLFLESQLYSEFSLYVLYAIFGVYGWWNWNHKPQFKISVLPYKAHALIIAIGVAAGLFAGYMFERYSKAALPYADALSSGFGLLATWLEAQRVLHHWLYWILINAFSVWLYAQRGLFVLGAQMFLFFLLSIWGWYRWKAKFVAQ